MLRTIATFPFYVCGFLFGATIAILECALSGVLRGLDRGFDTFEGTTKPCGDIPDEN